MTHRESVPNLKLQFQVIKWNYKRFLDEELLKSSQLVEEEKKFEENNMVNILYRFHISFSVNRLATENVFLAMATCSSRFDK